ncbi:formate dehydrogenase subunit gamma, partial [Pseudomonas aeruginosa]
FWLTNLFGGGPWTRILHPFLGLAMFVFFLGLVVRFAHHNRVQKSDIQWLKQWRDVVSNREENLPEVGRYNAGQKLLFWVLLLSMLTLLVTGIVIWRQYFSAWFGIEAIRLSALLHAFAAFVLIASIIVHIYAGIWVKGSMGAMLYGKVSRAWARKHHNGWLKEVGKGEEH